ncbi:MAG: hypothetical protein GSR78_04515 [Desulfurococcales archaeon]|nr:hypothetical protein [Desulfurococcales archaeon]
MILDVLEVLIGNGGGMNMTRLSQAANLSYAKLREIIEDLQANGAVEVRQDDGVNMVYITERGLRLASELRRLKQVLMDFNIDL